MWRTCRDANRPFPRISDDDVIDYMVMEAIALKVRKEERDAAEKAKREEWKQDRDKLKQTHG